MSKNRIKNLRDITVDGVEYKWIAVDRFKIWKDNRIIFEAGFHSEEKYPEVNYFTNYQGITPGIVAKVIRQINGTDRVATVEDLAYRLENESSCGIGYFGRNHSFDDKEAEKLWVEFNDKYKELKSYLEKNTEYYGKIKNQEA